MTRTIDEPIILGLDGPTISEDPTDRIIADYRATMGQMKCAMSERLVRLGISMAQLHIMYTLQRSGEMSMSRLADALNVSVSNATGLVDRMEERGFVGRTRVSADRRIVLVRVSAAGERVIEENDALSDDLLRRVLERLDPTQLPVVAHALAEFRAALDALTATPTSDGQPLSTPPSRSG